MHEILKKKFSEIIEGRALGLEEVGISARTLTPEEAIGNPEDRDYPLHKGKERLMEAEFKGSKGQAFTDMFGNFQGSLSQIIEMELSNNFRRAIFVSTINAVMRHLKLVERTIHCKDNGPVVCAQELVSRIKKEFGNPKVAMVGLQPRMVEALGREFDVRVMDLDEENIGKQKFGVVIDPPEKTAENLRWCDMALVTGTTIVNNTIGEFKMEKPVIFFGVTIAGPARLLGLPNFCPCGM